MNKGAPYRKIKLAQYECQDCDETYKLDEVDDHLKTHIEQIIFNKAMNAQGGW